MAQLAAELEQERSTSRAVQAEELNEQVQLSAAKTAQRLAQLESASSSEAARTESVDLKSQLRTLTAQLQETRGRMEEAQQVGQRYKEQIFEHREVRTQEHARDEFTRNRTGDAVAAMCNYVHAHRYLCIFECSRSPLCLCMLLPFHVFDSENARDG